MWPISNSWQLLKPFSLKLLLIMASSGHHTHGRPCFLLRLLLKTLISLTSELWQVPREPWRPICPHSLGVLIQSPGFSHTQVINCLMLPVVNPQSLRGLFPGLQFVSLATALGQPVSISSSAFSKADSWSASPPLFQQSPSLIKRHFLFSFTWATVFGVNLLFTTHNSAFKIYLEWPLLITPGPVTWSNPSLPGLLGWSPLYSLNQGDLLKSESYPSIPFGQSLSLAFWHSKQNSLSTTSCLLFSDPTSYSPSPTPFSNAVLSAVSGTLWDCSHFSPLYFPLWFYSLAPSP